MLIDLRDKLKPCPFCGRKVNLAGLQMGGIGVTRMDIECACGISFKIYADDVIYSKDGTPHQMGITALDKWQKRSEQMKDIILEKRYPHSRAEDITDAFMRGYEIGKEQEHKWWSTFCANCKDAEQTEPQTETPCGSCQEFDCYGCEYKQTERSE